MQRSWFSPYSITYLLQLAGYKNIRIEEFLDGDYLGVEAFPDFSGGATQEMTLEKPFQQFETFASAYREGVVEWQQKLDSWRTKKYNIALWGAGMRGINFLSHFSNLSNLALVIDINPLRQGKVLPKSGFPSPCTGGLKGAKSGDYSHFQCYLPKGNYGSGQSAWFTGHFEILKTPLTKTPNLLDAFHGLFKIDKIDHGNDHPVMSAPFVFHWIGSLFQISGWSASTYNGYFPKFSQNLPQSGGMAKTLCYAMEDI
ncbi:MAG: hypothetical protein IPO07_30170 [Haliscomenobacter sp.]|nr:hypothetical protein [Haliscomenobacter sp.]MBK9492574.1 hypothetical protein [Haliscomenobacter sp.]